MSSKTFGEFKMADSILSYAIYAARVSQSATSAPAATDLVNNFGATTFTWGRTSAGIYTITASTAVFTANKTFIAVSPPPLDLVSYKATVTSTTVVTITTNLMSVIATVLSAIPTDVLLINNLFEIKVFD